MKAKLRRKLLLTRVRSIIIEIREKNDKASEKTGDLGKRTRNERSRRMATVDNLLSQRLACLFARTFRQEVRIRYGSIRGSNQ